MSTNRRSLKTTIPAVEKHSDLKVCVLTSPMRYFWFVGKINLPCDNTGPDFVNLLEIFVNKRLFV